MTGKRTRYSSEFKQQAVELVDELGSVGEAAKQLELNRSTLQNWVDAKVKPVEPVPEPTVRKIDPPQKFVRRRVNAWSRRKK